jgi:hypothetical protein
MARKTILAAGALFLLLVGTRGKAQADETEAHDDARPGVLNLFGKAICTAETPADVRCDWRLPEVGPAPRTGSPAGFALTWFGSRYCVGLEVPGPCDRRVAAGEPPPQSKLIRLLGLDICFGNISPASRCDLTLPPLPEDAGQRHARL